MLVPVTENKKVITEEFRAWRSGGSQNRWRVGSLKKTAIAGNGFGPAPNVNKTVIQKPKRIAQTPDRYSFAPRHVRDMIKENRSKLEERFNQLQVMKKEDDE